MFGGEILNAVCEAQITIGGQMASDSISAENVSDVLVLISQAWAGKTETSRDFPTKGDMPVTGDLYTTSQIQFMVSYLAAHEQTASKTTLQKLQAESSAWTNLGSAMNNYASLQKSPFNTMQQGETSQIQQDQSAVSSSSSLGSGLADLDGIPATLLPNISV